MIVRIVDGREPGSIGLIPVMAGVVYFAARTALRFWHVGVSITSNEVLIIGPVRTKRVPISDAREFITDVRLTGGNGQPMICLNRYGTSPVNIWALSRNGFVWNLRRLTAGLQPLADELNQHLSEARSGTRPSGSRAA